MKGNSIHDCIGLCTNIYEAFKVKLENNVYYKGRKFMIQSLKSQSIHILDNLFIGLVKREARDIIVT